MPGFEENSRYTVACGTSEVVLIASMVVAPYPRSRNSARAASSTARRASLVRACCALELSGIGGTRSDASSPPCRG